MRTLLLIILILPIAFYYSCHTQKGGEKTAQSDSLPAAPLDRSSPENFIQSLVNSRKSANSGKGDFNVSGKLVFSKGDFHIMNFMEQIGDYSYAYAIVLNPNEKKEFDNPDKDSYIDVQALMKAQSGLNYAEYIGNFKASEDFFGDGSPDFILDVSTSIRTDFNRKQTLVLYDGQNKLTVTQITTSSALESGTQESGFQGFKEEFEFKGENPVMILVNRTEDNYGKETITYDKTWRWLKAKSAWETGLICKELDNPDYKIFINKLTRLLKKDGEYIIPENCQNGGAGFFNFKRITTSGFSDYYVIQVDGDDIGYNVAISILRKDSLSYDLITGRYEPSMDPPTISGERELNSEFRDNNIFIKRDSLISDIYWFTYKLDPANKFPFTTSPAKYKFVKCNHN